MGIKTKLAAAVALGALSIGTASAAPFVSATWNDSYDAHDLYMNVGDTKSFSLDLSSGPSAAFRPGIDVLQSATLSVSISDDAGFDIIDWLLLPEEASFSYDGSAFGGLVTNVVGYLSADGLLNIIVKAKVGDFIFEGASLHATGLHDNGAVAPPTSVPEPATLSLLGLGLLGAAFARRKRAI